MAPVGPLLRLWKPRPTESVSARRSASAALTTIALVLALFVATPLPADEFPGSLLGDSRSPIATAPAVVDVQSRPSWWGIPNLAPRFVAIDESPPTSGFSTPSWLNPAAASSSSSWWTALSRWEARLWHPERPTITLTSAETSSIGFDEEAPPLPQDGITVLAPNQSDMTPAQAGSDFQPIDICAPPIRFTDDAWAFLPRLGRDAWGLVNWDNAIILGVALGGSLALRGEVDQDVRNWTNQHPDRWGEGSKIIGDLGVAQYQVPVILGAYAFTVWEQDQYGHDMMGSLISAYSLFGVSTLAIKVVADTKRPSDQWNGGNYGFPSWHDGSMFCMAAVIDEYEGHWVGVPLYILSGLIGFSRIDTRDHDLSDVVFGGVLGYVIGKSVAGRALYGDSRAVHIVPYFRDGSAGLMFDTSF
ncbi:MAG TPA: phosphatase PAP2 family protein [Planctomycetaceae bacterium]|jgi:hypothetical protein|nr:phosphatase PAP2 family protein [Planctomycetaceae bacterium]